MLLVVEGATCGILVHGVYNGGDGDVVVVVAEHIVVQDGCHDFGGGV